MTSCVLNRSDGAKLFQEAWRTAQRHRSLVRGGVRAGLSGLSAVSWQRESKQGRRNHKHGDEALATSTKEGESRRVRAGASGLSTAHLGEQPRAAPALHGALGTRVA